MRRWTNATKKQYFGNDARIGSILSPNEYQVVILTIVYNMKQKDIAQYLDKPMGTVSWLYSQGIKKLKKYYQKGER